MKRVIKTYETCSDELLSKLAEKFPNGIKEKHISKIPTVKGDMIRVVEIQTEDTVYLIKFSPQLEEAIDNFDLEIEEEDIEISDDIDANVVAPNADDLLDGVEDIDED